MIQALPRTLAFAATISLASCGGVAENPLESNDPTLILARVNSQMAVERGVGLGGAFILRNGETLEFAAPVAVRWTVRAGLDGEPSAALDHSDGGAVLSTGISTDRRYWSATALGELRRPAYGRFTLTLSTVPETTFVILVGDV